eukprot:2980193-Pyramimonas_sp.AAC.1
MRTVPLRASVELPMGPILSQRKRQIGLRDARGRSHWGLRWSPLWGHEARHCAGENAKLHFPDAYG